MKTMRIVGVFAILTTLFSSFLFAQKAKPAAKPAKQIIFAVLNDGGSVEPIAYFNKGKLEKTVDGGDDSSIIAAFNKTYYKTGTIYRMIFGGSNAGTVSIKSSDPKADCAPNMAQTTSKSAKTTLKGFVMALGTNAPISNKFTSYRRKPTAAEKAEIDVLARSVYKNEKLTPKVLRYQNLTALDLNHDGKAEFVGSYWIDIDKITRGLVFLIAEQGTNGKYVLGHSEYKSIDQQGTMSGDIKDVDTGIYHEVLLDVFDFDSDGQSEVFTYVPSFEGAGFNVYKKAAGKWSNVFEGFNYHCGY